MESYTLTFFGLLVMTFHIMRLYLGGVGSGLGVIWENRVIDNQSHLLGIYEFTARAICCYYYATVQLLSVINISTRTFDKCI